MVPIIRPNADPTYEGAGARAAIGSPAEAGHHVRSLGFTAGALALFVLLTVAHTWPLAAAPASWSRNDAADTILHEWILAWVPHQLLNDPLHLFDANIFYPERSTLAYSDPLIVQSLIGAPLLWAGGSPVLVYNIVLMAGFALTGWAMCLVVARWTGSRLAGIVSGTLVAFNAFTLTRLTQIQDQHLEFFPLVLVALDRLLAAPRPRRALELAGSYVLQSLTGHYLLVFTAISIVAATLARPREWLGAQARRFLPNAALAAAVSIVLLAPVLLPYYYVSRDQGLTRSLQETETFSAHLITYLSAAGTLHFNLWSRPFFQGDALFPGVTALALAAAAAAAGVAVTDRRARMVAVMGIVAAALSFGPAFPPYRWLYAVFPLMSGIRGAVRLGQIVLIAIGILAGFGLAAIQRRVPRRWEIALAAVLLLAVNVEAWRAPIGYTRYRGIPPIYDALGQAGPRAVLVWLPFHPPQQSFLDAPFMLVSTRWWQPMLNGYSGFRPASYDRHYESLKGFPDNTSIDYLQQLGVTHVLVDGRNMRREQMDRLPRFPALRFWITDGNLRIYLLAH
jgi:flagellar biosynthesis protein FliQ